MPKQNPTSGPQSGSLPKHLEDFCQLISAGETQDNAAQKVGRNKCMGWRYMQKPEIKARVEQLKQEYARELVQQRAQRTVREITFDRNDIIIELGNIGGIGDPDKAAESERAKVAALLGLADIFMLRAKNVREIKDFHGWTADELREYAINGTIPARIRLLVGEGFSTAAGGTESLRTDKK